METMANKKRHDSVYRKEFAAQMRSGAVIRDGIVHISEELWFQIADMLEGSEERSVCEARPKASMTDTTKENRIIAADLRALAGRIHAHLFGLEDGESSDKVADPRCLQEELQRTQWDLKETHAILSGIAGLLGM